MVALPSPFDARKVPINGPNPDHIKFDYEYIIDQIRPNSLHFVRELASDGFQNKNKWIWKANYRGERKAGSAYVELNSGQWSDLGGEGGGRDFISFYGFHHGLDNQDAARDICDKYGYEPNRDTPAFTPRRTLDPNPPIPTEEESANKNAEAVRKIVANAIPASADNPAGRYLANRQIESNNDIVYARDYNGEHMCIFIGRSASDKVMCIQRVYIDDNGNKLSDPETGEVRDKLTLGPCKNHPHKIPALREDNPDRLIILEGPEDGHSSNYASGYETWVMFGGANLRNCPATGRDILIFADSDQRPETIERVNAAVQALTERNKSVNVIYPPHSYGDANKMVQSGVEEDLMELIEGGFSCVKESGLPLEWADDVQPSLDVNDFVEGLLCENSMSVIYGGSNTGKTFFVLDLAMRIALGWKWRDRAVEQGAVVYVACEGGHSIKNRISAFKKHFDVKQKIPLALIPSSVDLLNPEADTSELIAAVIKACEAAGDVKMVIIDTLARAMAGGDENTSSDMSQLIINADNIRETTGAHVCFIHHSGKNVSAGARGHSSLRAATDTEIEISRDPGTDLGVVEVKKQRDLEGGEEFYFELSSIILGKNRRGKPVTSCAVIPTDKSKKSKKRNIKGKAKRGYEKLVKSMIDDAIEAPSNIRNIPEGIKRVTTLEAWKRRLESEGVVDLDGSNPRQQYDRIRDKLLDEQLIAIADGYVWVTDVTDRNRLNLLQAHSPEETVT